LLVVATGLGGKVATTIATTTNNHFKYSITINSN